jgi:hypothetical protein
LLRDKSLGFSQPEEFAGHRILDYDRGSASRPLRADNQVAPEPWKTWCHDFLEKKSNTMN